MLAEADTGPVKQLCLAEQVLNLCNGGSFRHVAIFVRDRRSKERFCLFYVVSEVRCTCSIVTVKAADIQEFAYVMTVSNEERHFLKLLQGAIWVTVYEDSEDFLNVVSDSVLVV